MGSRSCRACSNSLRALAASTFPQGWRDPGSSHTNRRHARKMSRYKRMASKVVLIRTSTRLAPVGMNFAMMMMMLMALGSPSDSASHPRTWDDLGLRLEETACCPQSSHKLITRPVHCLQMPEERVLLPAASLGLGISSSPSGPIIAFLQQGSRVHGLLRVGDLLLSLEIDGAVEPLRNLDHRAVSKRLADTMMKQNRILVVSRALPSVAAGPTGTTREVASVPRNLCRSWGSLVLFRLSCPRGS
jgi:hypothetical protein